MFRPELRTLRSVLPALAAFAAVSAVIAGSFDYPKRKPGEWQITISSPNPKYPPRVESVCLDAATDALLYEAGVGASRNLCPSSKWMTVSGSHVIADLSCKLGARQTQVHAEITLTGNTAYRQAVTTHYDPPLAGKSELRSTQDGKWIGACPSDMKPGDVVVKPSPMMPMTMRMNLNDMLKGAR